MQNTGIHVDTSKLLEYSDLIKVSNTLVTSIYDYNGDRPE